MYLDSELRKKKIKTWRRQEWVKLVVNGKTITNYIVDFVTVHRDGREEYIEMKGAFTPAAVIKIKLFKALFPNRKYTLVRSKG